MATIRMHRQHELGVTKAKKAVDKVARHIREKFDIDARWNRNTLEFSRTGVEGEIAVEADSVSVHADISWLLLPIKSAIEQEIGRYLDQEFGS
ncbi:MAG: polyhydroxyalkanoic acid system family protein [Rhodanobacteraceae bacterium]|nr:polyhydroxyalkanoic acid system family protein [Rhodanobacteraceae bacterium]